jgi:hypothetical protein
MEPTTDTDIQTYRDALTALARQRGEEGAVPHVLLTDAQYLAKMRGEPSYCANLALDALVAAGVFVQEFIGDGGIPIRQERVDRLLRLLAGDPGLARDMAMEEARAVVVRWRLL